MGDGSACDQGGRRLMKLRALLSSLHGLIVLVFVVVLLVPGSAAAKKPTGGGGGGGFSTTSTYVKNYAIVLNGVQYDLTPEDVQATPDGGWIALAITDSATNGVGVA